MKETKAQYENYGLDKAVAVRFGVEEYYIVLDLLAARQTIQRLKEDGERLAKLLEVIDAWKISVKWDMAQKLLDQHNALMKEIGG